jgi:hypothetical protein
MPEDCRLRTADRLRSPLVFCVNCSAADDQLDPEPMKLTHLQRLEAESIAIIDSPYEAPESLEFCVNTVECSVDEASDRVIALMQQQDDPNLG